MLDQDLLKSANTRIRINIEEQIADLKRGIRHVEAEMSERGMLHSGMTLVKIKDLCTEAVNKRGELIWQTLHRFLATSEISYSDGLAKELKQIVESHLPKKLGDIRGFFNAKVELLRPGKTATHKLNDEIEGARQHALTKQYTEIDLFVHSLKRNHKLKFSGIAHDAFSSVREAVDREIENVIPAAAQKFAAIHENLRSSNPEDWSNAVHSCRRILQDLADVLFPPQAESRYKNEKEIKLGPEHYKNRLMCFVEDNSTSRRFKHLVGSHLRFLGDRLDSIFQAVQKGSHGSVEQREANRYVVYTYMIVGDILSLRGEAEQGKT